MMGERRVMQEALFYGLSLERHVPSDHLIRKIDRFVDLFGTEGAPRALLQRRRFGVRSERRLCEEVHLNLADRWFCRLGLDADIAREANIDSP
jgi:transposase